MNPPDATKSTSFAQHRWILKAQCAFTEQFAATNKDVLKLVLVCPKPMGVFAKEAISAKALNMYCFTSSFTLSETEKEESSTSKLLVMHAGTLPGKGTEMDLYASKPTMNLVGAHDDPKAAEPYHIPFWCVATTNSADEANLQLFTTKVDGVPVPGYTNKAPVTKGTELRVFVDPPKKRKLVEATPPGAESGKGKGGAKAKSGKGKKGKKAV